jgi:CHAT domain-containing protein
VHIANHGRFDASTPLQSGLYLLQGGEEHLLPVDELYELGLAADLVFLSGCDTGRVSVQKNEEPIGLLAPLLGGKTRSAVLSFWPIPGGLELTGDLVAGFYRYWLAEGLPRAEALRRAMLDHSEHPNPYLWGGYGFYGAV